MTNISHPLKLRPDRPVEPLALRVISEIHQASRELGFPVFLVGAVARIILLENIHGLQAGRGTTDLDFAFALDNWDQFRAIKDRLLASAKFEESKHPMAPTYLGRLAVTLPPKPPTVALLARARF
jgi:predicted nucleotidyltransferase